VVNFENVVWNLGFDKRREFLDQLGEVSMSEGNSCTVKVIMLVSCHMWVEGDCSLQLYDTVLC
jgi:hypothetical protein